MNEKQFLLCKKLSGGINHHQLLNEEISQIHQQEFQNGNNVEN